MVAEFVAVPANDDAAIREATLLRERVPAELVTAPGPQRAFTVEVLPQPVDILDDRVTVLASARARESRVAVVVCGRVTLDGEMRSDLKVITDDKRQRRLRSSSDSREQPLLPGQIDLPPAAMDLVAQAAAASQLTLGLAFLTRGRTQQAVAILQPMASDALAQFHAGYCRLPSRRCGDRHGMRAPFLRAACMATRCRARELGALRPGSAR